MSLLRFGGLAGLLLLAPVTARAQEAEQSAPGVVHPPLPEPEAGPALRLSEVLAEAAARSPEIREPRQREIAARARTAASGRLPDLELRLEQWGTPLARPWAFDEAQMVMLGVRQTVPAPGTLGAREQTSEQDAKIAGTNTEVRLEDLVLRVRRAFHRYYASDRAYRIHLEHVGLTERIVELARVQYRSGRTSQQSVLRTMLALSRVHGGLSDLLQTRASSQALLNSFMARPPEAPLGVPEEPELVVPGELASEERPELLRAELAVKRSEAELEGARSAARWPELMFGLDYWYMPRDDMHAWSGMIGMTLPWLNPRWREERTAAEHSLSAERTALEAARIAVKYEKFDAAARVKAARDSFAILEHDVLVQARQSFDAAQARFATGDEDALGVLDALSSLLEVRIEHVDARARLADAIAELERANGSGRARIVGETR